MALLSTSPFATLTKLLIAARTVAAGDDPMKRAEALTDLAGDPGHLNWGLRGKGLTLLAVELQKMAENADLVFAHDGPNKDNARLVFWQVVPVAISESNLMLGRALSAEATTEDMLRVIRSKSVGADLFREPLGEGYFRAIITPLLAKMFEDPAYIAMLQPVPEKKSR